MSTYTGPLTPFYEGTHEYSWDPTLQYQAPRPGSHAWFDKTLTYQAKRGGLYGIDQIDTGTKVMFVAGALLTLGGVFLLVRA